MQRVSTHAGPCAFVIPIALLLAVLTGCGDSSADALETQPAEPVTLSSERAKQIFNEYLAAFRSGDLESALTYLPDSFPTESCESRDAALAALESSRAMGPPLEYTVVSVEAFRKTGFGYRTVLIAREGDRRFRLPSDFVRQDGRWRLAQVYPVEAPARCAEFGRTG